MLNGWKKLANLFNDGEKLDLNHQELLQDRLIALEPTLSEYTFANLYLFRNIHDYELIFDTELFIKGKTRDGLVYLMPTSHPKNWNEETFQRLKQANLCLYPIPNEWRPFIDHYIKKVLFLEDDNDYLFATKKFALYPGRHLSNKRNLVKQLNNHFKMNIIPYHPELFQDTFNVLEAWQKEHQGDPSDYKPCLEALEQSVKLKLQSLLFYIDGEAVGFLIGEHLNANTFVIHFNKVKKRIVGLPQAMYQEIAKRLVSVYEWVNIEQDLGIPGLKEAKHSYHPDRLLQKNRVWF